MATAPSQRSLDKQAAADLLVQPQDPTKLELMQASSFSHIVSLQSEDIRQSILTELHADKPANGYTADAAAQIAENVSKHRTDEWPFLKTYNENVGHMVARTDLSEQSTRLMEILKENPIDSFEKRSPSLMDYGQTLLAVELNLRPNISETEKLPSLLRGIETAAHHNAYDQYHYNFDYTKEPAANYMDIALDAKERTKPFIEAVFNDPVIMRDINSEKKRYFDMDTGPDGLLKDASVAAAIFPDEASPHAQQVLLSSINALPYSAQQEAAESLMLSKDFGMDFSLESAKDSLTSLMALRDKTYPNKVADDLSQRELFTEAFDMSLVKNPAPVNQSPEPINKSKPLELPLQYEELLNLVSESDLGKSAGVMGTLLRNDFERIEASAPDDTTPFNKLPVLLQHINNEAMDSVKKETYDVNIDVQTKLVNKLMSNLTKSAYADVNINPDVSHSSMNDLYNSDVSELMVDGKANSAYFHPDSTAETNQSIASAMDSLSAPEQQVALYGLKTTAQVGISNFNQVDMVKAVLMTFDENQTKFGIPDVYGEPHPSAHDKFTNAFKEANELALALAPAVDSPDTAYLLSAIDRDLKNAYANNMLAGLNKDYAELYQSTKDGKSNPELITNKGIDFLDNANAFGSVVNAIADKSRGDADYQQELKDTMKELSAYVDDTAHIIGYVNHDTGNEADALHRGRDAMQGMDKHREVLDSTIASFNEVAPAVVNENTNKAPAPRR